MLEIFFGILLIILTVIGNLLVVISILCVKTLRRPCNLFILSVAVADLKVGLVVLPLQIVVAENSNNLDHTHVLCYAWTSVIITSLMLLAHLLCCNASVFSLTLISLDRYLAIRHPLLYHSKVTAKKAAMVISVTWIVALLIALLHWVLPTSHQEATYPTVPFSVCLFPEDLWYILLGAVGTFFLPLCIMFFVYGNIWHTLAAQKAKIVMSEPSLPRGSTVSETCSVDTNDNGPVQCIPVRITYALHEKKGCIMMVIVVGVFILCWLPLYSMWIVIAVSRTIGRIVTIPSWVYDACISLSYLNSCLNPLIYTMFSQEFRFIFTEILCLRGFSLNSKIKTITYTKQSGVSGTGR